MGSRSGLESFAQAERALVFGLGGGGDIVSAVPTGRFLELFGCDVLFGGIAWEPIPRDVNVGPRPLEEVTDITPQSPHIAQVSPTTETVDGTPIAEAGVCAHVDNDVLLFDVTDGLDPLAAEVSELVKAREVDLVVGVDAGGDAVATGTEPGVKSPITDALGVAMLTTLDVPTAVGLHGYGSDGELSSDELEAAIADIAAANGLLGAWGITPDVRGELETLLESVSTEASRLPVAAARGEFGEYEIRDGRRTVTVSPTSIVTFYLEPEPVAARSSVVDIVMNTSDLQDVADHLQRRGIQTEFDTERERSN